MQQLLQLQQDTRETHGQHVPSSDCPKPCALPAPGQNRCLGLTSPALLFPKCKPH